MGGIRTQHNVFALSVALDDVKKLDVEDEVGVGWDTAGAFAAVGELCGYSDSTLTADGHAGNAAVPALDHFAAAESKGEWWAFLIGWDAR